MKEIRELLEQAEKHISKLAPTSGHNPLNSALWNIQKALALLKEPPAGKFTKATRQVMIEFLNIYGENSEIFPPIGAEQVIELCDIIYSQAARIKELENEISTRNQKGDR